MCNIGNEDAVHFILYCNHSDKIEYYKRKFFDCMGSPEIEESILAEGDEYFIKLILNTELVSNYGLDREVILRLEYISREWIFEQHKLRAKKLEYRI